MTVEPTPEMLAERSARADRATRGALAAILCFEAVVVLLVPRTLARTGYGLTTTRTSILIALAVVLAVFRGRGDIDLAVPADQVGELSP